jgi:hypothetical protein
LYLVFQWLYLVFQWLYLVFQWLYFVSSCRRSLYLEQLR